MPDVVAADSPIVILGAGINGASLARELVLNGCSVVLIDRADLGSGTTAYSSRLIHGGLRYLEYGDSALVRESLAERDRLLRLAPDFVRPLEFRVPTSSRLGGLVGSATKYLFGKAWGKPRARGAWLVRIGLKWYGRLSRYSPLSEPRSLDRLAVAKSRLAAKYTGVAAYYDAQMRFPERFVVALVDDARREAERRGLLFRVHTYANVAVRNEVIVVTDEEVREEPSEYRPTVVVNAGGPWADAVLRNLGVPGSQLIAGTKGTHFVTFHDGLQTALGGAALYVEAVDGRPVFVLPFGTGTLVGTTDLPFQGDPAAAVASEAELTYLIDLVNGVLPEVRLTRGDVKLHYAGVRPLPRSDAATPAAVTRRHGIVEQPGLPWSTWTLVGGKLTTCRSLAEEAAAVVLKRLGKHAQLVSDERPIADRAVSTSVDDVTRPCIADTEWKRQHVRQIIRGEFVRRLEDLVERRLMLHFMPRLTRATLDDLASLLVEEKLLAESHLAATVEAVVARLRNHFGRELD